MISTAWALVAGPGGRGRVLVVDTLGSLGLRVEEATRVPARRLAEDPPRVIVLDDHRERAQREASQRRLRAYPALRLIPLIVVSREGDIEAFAGAFAQGASAFLPTPVDPADLWDVARRLAAWRPPRRPGSAQAPRCPLVLGVDVDVPGQGWRRGLIVDASASGCRLEMTTAVHEGVRLGIVPRGGGRSTGIRLGGSVRWRRPLEGRRQVLGVRWSATTALLAGHLLGLPMRGGRASG